jgi:uncharacterized Zn-binding protein involved in type VI secretion
MATLNIARKSGSGDVVNTVHVSVGDADSDDGIACDAAPQNINTDEGSTTVFAEFHGVVRQGDKVQAHTIPGCSTHAPGLATYSGNVYVENKKVGREGDTYGCGAKITSVGQGTVWANKG